jgi:hypothetical protein
MNSSGALRHSTGPEISAALRDALMRLLRGHAYSFSSTAAIVSDEDPDESLVLWSFSSPDLSCVFMYTRTKTPAIKIKEIMPIDMPTMKPNDSVDLSLFFSVVVHVGV